MIAALPEGGEERLDELKELLLTAGAVSVGEVIQRREQPHPNTYLGPGKLDELKAALKASDANLVACDDELSPARSATSKKRSGCR